MNTVPANQIIHLKSVSLDGGLIGISPLRALSKEMQLQDANKGLALGAMKNGLNITGLLKINISGFLEGVTKKSVRRDFERRAESGHIVVLDDLEDYQALEVNRDISKLLSSTDWTSEQIAKVYGVPQDYLGSESEHSNIEMVAIQYAQTIGRYIRGVVSEIKKKFYGEIDYDINDISDIDRQQVEKRVRGLVADRVIGYKTAQKILIRGVTDLFTQEDIVFVDIPFQSGVSKLKGGDNTDDKENSGTTGDQ
ncbi:hypothetical protein ATN92_11035 [Companilactobacillus bobalius]|nr:hypothetical protein ATN92_11035 [Companilactobacillus bobalius]